MTGPTPGNPEMVSDPKYMSVYHTPTRAKSPVNCVTPSRKAKGGPVVRAWKPLVPKKGTQLGARGELAIFLSKIEHCQLNSHPFHVTFSGINRVRKPAEGGILFNFYFKHFCTYAF